MLESFARIFKA